MRQLEAEYCQAEKAPKELHFPCTLDQAYYLSLRSSIERDKTQVVVKHAERRERDKTGPNILPPEEADNSQPKAARTPKKLRMVSQLWLWQIDDSKFPRSPNAPRRKQPAWSLTPKNRRPYQCFPGSLTPTPRKGHGPLYISSPETRKA
jgi:hypothetical protein